LHHGAERHVAGKVFRRAQDDRITDAMMKLPCDTNIVRMYCPAILAHVTITFASNLSRRRALPSRHEDRDALAVFAHARERRAEFRLGLVLRSASARTSAR